MTCHNLDFGTRVLDLVAVGSSSNASIERHAVKNHGKTVTSKVNGARRMVCCRQSISRTRVFSTNTSEALLNGNIFASCFNLVFGSKLFKFNFILGSIKFSTLYLLLVLKNCFGILSLICLFLITWLRFCTFLLLLLEFIYLELFFWLLLPCLIGKNSLIFILCFGYYRFEFSNWYNRFLSTLTSM